MMTSILGILAGAATIAGGIIAYRNSANRQRRLAERDVERKEEEMQTTRDEIRRAVHGGDEARVNEIAARILAPAACWAACACLLAAGCAARTAVVYVPTDRRIEPCTNSLGIACQAVPNAVFCELLERAQELKELKRERAVDRRLGK